MRPRTFILIILVLLLAVLAVVFYLLLSGSLDIGGLLSGGAQAPTTQAPDDGPAVVQPVATPTPSVIYEEVVVSTIDIPVGARIREEFLRTEMRPETNIAIQAGYTFSLFEEVTDRIARVPIARGQAILNSMIALTPTDLATMGSDLSLYVQQGNVALAMPINRFSGAAYAMRPGDRVDVMMSLTLVKVDEAFHTALPNFDERVDPFALQEGRSFLFSPIAAGRLEQIQGLNLVASIGPGGQGDLSFGDVIQIPRRVTQLTIQQAEVVWVGTWGITDAFADPPPTLGEQETGAISPTATPDFARVETQPDIVVLSMSPQDALALKWAMDRGIDIDLALRSQGDNSVFATTTISLPQLVDQGGLTIPQRGGDDIQPRADEVDPPQVPLLPPSP